MSTEYWGLSEEGFFLASPNPWYGYFYAIKSYNEFLQNYRILFSKNTKEKILNGTPVPEGTVDGNCYEIKWTDDAVYRLMFAHIEDVGYKFVGLQIEPL